MNTLLINGERKEGKEEMAAYRYWMASQYASHLDKCAFDMGDGPVTQIVPVPYCVFHLVFDYPCYTSRLALALTATWRWKWKWQLIVMRLTNGY